MAHFSDTEDASERECRVCDVPQVREHEADLPPPGLNDGRAPRAGVGCKNLPFISDEGNFCLQWHKDVAPIVESLDRGSALRRKIYCSDFEVGGDVLYHWHPSTWAADDNTAEAAAVGLFQAPTDAEDAVKSRLR